MEIYHKIIEDCKNNIIPLECGFNLCLLLKKMRDIYFFDTYYQYHKKKVLHTIKYIENFNLFSIYYRGKKDGKIFKINEQHLFDNFRKTKDFKKYNDKCIIISVKGNTQVLNKINKDL